MKKKKLWCVIIANSEDRDLDMVVHVRCNSYHTAIRKAAASIGTTVDDLEEDPIVIEVIEEEIIK